MTPMTALPPSGDALGAVASWAVSLMDALGAPGVGLAVALENVFPPIPSEVILPLAGFAAARGAFDVVSALLWATAGSIAGAAGLYALGAWWGLDRLKTMAARLPLMDPHDVDRSNDWFARHGAKAVLFGRMLPLFRSLISIPAGVTRMRMLVFCLLTALGSSLWNALFIGAGFLLGDNWQRVEDYAGIAQGVVVALIVVGVTWCLARRIMRRRAGGRKLVPRADERD